MTMDHEVVEEGCKNCSALRNEIDKRNVQMENSNAQQLAGFLTLKQKIIGTDKLIREYQASKVERDILTRKNEEFVHLIDQLHRDLSIRNQEYTQLCGNAEHLRKSNSEYEVKVKHLCDEAQKWKFQAEAGQNFTSQLVEKVKILEKYEEEVKHTATVSRECEKTESKLQILKGQLKDAKETATKSKKELTKMQKNYTQLMKYAKQWGRFASTHGKFNITHKRFFAKLFNNEGQEDEGDENPDTVSANEIDEQSKLLEHLLDGGNVSESVVTPMDPLLNDTAISVENLACLSKRRGKSLGDSIFSKQTEQTPISAQRRSDQDKGASSKIQSPNKTPPRSPGIRARTRTASQNSISQSSDADNTLESEKENSKRPGPRTRSRSVKITQLPGPKGSELSNTPESKSAISQSTLPESVHDTPCRSLVSMDTLLMTEPTLVQSLFQKANVRVSLSSSDSEAELPVPLKLVEDDGTVTKTSTTSTTESIIGVKQLMNLFENDMSNDTSKQRSGNTEARKLDQYVAKALPEFETSVNPSSLFGFDSDSSSDSDIDMIPVPTCELPIVNKTHERNILHNSKPPLPTAFLSAFGKTTSNPNEKPVIEEVPHIPASRRDTGDANNAPKSIFTLDANLDINSPTQDSNATESLQEKTPEIPNLAVSVPLTSSLDEELITVIPESVDMQGPESHQGIVTLSNGDSIEKLRNEMPIVEPILDFELLVANGKNLEKSAAMIVSISPEKLDEPSSLLVNESTTNDVKSSTKEPPEHPESGAKESDTNSVTTNVFALDMDLDTSSSEPVSDVAKPTKETECDFSNAEVILQAPSTLLDEEPSTVQGIVQDVNSHDGYGDVLTVEANRELHSEVITVETNREPEQVQVVSGENLGESPGVEMDVPFKKHEEPISEQVDESKESENKSVTRDTLPGPMYETGELNSNTIPNSISVLDVDLDIGPSDTNLEVSKPTKEAKSEFSCTEVVLQSSVLSLDEESSTVVRRIIDVQDSLKTIKVNQEVRSEVLEMETNRESERLVVSEENLEELRIEKEDSPSNRHEELNSPLTDESTKSEEKSITKKSLQITALETMNSNTNNGPSSIFALDMDLDISTSETDSDVTEPAEGKESKLLNAEDVVEAQVPLDEEPSTVTPEGANVQSSDSHYGCHPVSNEIRNEVQPVESNREQEPLVVNDENSVVSPGDMKIGVPPKTQEETNFEQMEGGSASTEMAALTKNYEETNPEQIDESAKSEDQSVIRNPQQDPMSGRGESNTESNVDLDISSCKPGSNMENPTGETESGLPDAEIVSQASSSLDPVPSSFVPGSVMVQESNTGQGCSAISNVRTNQELCNEVPAEEINRESRILPVCRGDNFGESPCARIDNISKNHKEQNTEQIDGLRKIEEDPVTTGSPTVLAPGMDKPHTTTLLSSIFALDVDFDISSSEPESDATNHPVEEKSKFSNKEVILQRSSSMEETPSTISRESVDGESPYMKTDIPSKGHEEPSSQQVSTSIESVEKPLNRASQQSPASVSGDMETNSVHCTISALNVDLDISSSEPDSDDATLVEETKFKLPNTEINIQVPLLCDEEPNRLVPVKVIVQHSESLHDSRAVPNVGADPEDSNEVLMVEGNREIGEVTGEVIAPVINQKVQVIRGDESLSEKATDEELPNEAQTMSNVLDEQKLSVLHAIPASQTTVSSKDSPLSPSCRVIPGPVLSSNHLVQSKEKREVRPLLELEAIKSAGIQSPRRVPVTDPEDGNPTNKDTQLQPIYRPGSVQESFISPMITSNLPESSIFPPNTQILQPVRTSAFKVPRVPNAPSRVPDTFSTDLVHNYPWSRGTTQGVKRSAADDEVAVILKQIRTNIIDMPATVSPLPRSPEPQPVVPAKVEEPKSRFPVLPRCAFNWTGKKLPLSDKLTERFGAYLHPGVQTRVRFRRVSRRLQDIRSPDILSNCLKGVTNFAEAERRPKPIVAPIQFVGDIDDFIGSEHRAIEPTQKPDISVQDSNNLPEKRTSAASSTEEIEEAILSERNPTSSTKKKKKVKAHASRPKPMTPALFGSSSSESESESTVVSQPIKEQVIKSSTVRNLNEKKPVAVLSKEIIRTPSIVNTSRAQAMAQLVESIIPLGRGNRSDFPPIKSNEVRREAESIFNQSRIGLGLGRGAKVSQPTIAPCSDALVSATIKSKSINRAVASPKHVFKEPLVPIEPVPATPILSDGSPAQDKNPFKKRVSHALKRGLEFDLVAVAVSPASKRGRNLGEVLPPVSSQTGQPKITTETRLEEICVSARPKQKSRSILLTQPQEMVKLGVKETIIEEALNESDSVLEKEVPMEVTSKGTSQSSCSEIERTVPISSVAENSILTEDSRIRHQLVESSELSVVDESPQSPDVEESPRSPDVEESPRSPDIEESPRSPDIEVSQQTLDVEGSSKSRDDQPLKSPEKNGRSTPAVLEIPLVSSAGIEEHQPTAFELILKELHQESPPVNPKVSKLRKEINQYVNKVFKHPDVTEELWNGLIERAMRFDGKNNPFVLIRKLVASVIKEWDSPMDLSKTPPAPPMAHVHQRCVMILKELDEANSKLSAEPSVNLNMYSNLFLSESSAIMFQQVSSLTLEEMCSLARAYTAVCRSRSCLARARTFLFDCVYFVPPRSYALTYTIVSVWADVLRQISFPLGPSCIDQTISYLLLHNCKIKAVPGIAGKVLQVRSFLQNTYGYKNVTTRTIDDLVNYLMTRFKETNSTDEASSLSWSLALLSRWEGIDFAIEVIEKQLWPFLQRWSSGEGTNSGAAAVIVAIGMLGKTVPSSKRAGVKRVLSAMKVLLQSDEVIPSIHEAAIEAVVLLGEDEDPKSVIEVVKAWKLVNTNLSQHLRQVLKAFLKRHSSLCVA